MTGGKIAPFDIIDDAHRSHYQKVKVPVLVDRLHEQARFIDASLRKCCIRGCNRWIGEPDFEHPQPVPDNPEGMCAEHWSNFEYNITHSRSK